MFDQFILRLVTIVLAIVAAILLAIMLMRNFARVPAASAPIPESPQTFAENPPPGPLPADTSNLTVLDKAQQQTEPVHPEMPPAPVPEVAPPAPPVPPRLPPVPPASPTPRATAALAPAAPSAARATASHAPITASPMPPAATAAPAPTTPAAARATASDAVTASSAPLTPSAARATAPRSVEKTDSSPVTSPERSVIARTGVPDSPVSRKAPGKFIVYSRGNELPNGFRFAETDEKFGMNSPGDIAWEFDTQAEALRGSAALKWFLDGKPRGYPMPLSEDMLRRKQIYPDMPEPGVWQIKLARHGEKDLLLFTFTISKEDKEARQ